MEDKIQKVEQVAKKDWRVVMSWVGGISALLGLFASLAGGIAWFVNHYKQKIFTFSPGRIRMQQTWPRLPSTRSSLFSTAA